MKENGVSLDELVGILTRTGREVEQIGVSNTCALLQRVASVIKEANPLLVKGKQIVIYVPIQEIAEDVQPLPAEVHNGGLLNEVKSLIKSLTEASEDLRRIQSSILTPENIELIRKSIYSLIFTLKNIENISFDILAFTGDGATRRNLKPLIKSLSRLI